MSDSYMIHRQHYAGISGTVVVDTLDTEPSLAPASLETTGVLQTMFIQKGTITVQQQGAIGTTWTLGDDQGAFISSDYQVDTDSPTDIAFDFGARGRPLTEGAGLILVCSQPGAGGIVTFEGYRKLTGQGAT